MTKRFKAAGVLFLAASSVYALQALGAKPQSAVRTPSGASASPVSTSIPPGPNTGTDVKVLDADTDPFAPGSSGPGKAEPVADTSNQGTSVTADSVTVSDEGSVEIHVNDAALVEVLRMLSIQSQKNIVASKEVGGKVTANLYGVTVREALDAILHANGFAYREKGNFIYVYTAKEIAEMEKAERVTSTEIFRLFYTPAANASNIIKPVLSDAAQVALSTPADFGIATGTDDTGGNAHATEDVLVVTDYPENLERVRKILKEVDRRPQQILIEATILRAALSEDNALGVDFNVLAGVNFSNLITNLGGQVIGGNTGEANNPLDGSAGGIGTGNNFTSDIQGGLKLGFVSDNVSVFLAALEGVTDTAVLANPKVLAVNKQKGEVIVGRRDGYLTTTVTESSTVQTVEFLDTGTRLIFRPFIGDDGYIRMEIHPEDSSGGLTADNLPFKITTEVTSNVMIKDGHTIVIGGLFREASDSSRSQVPGFGNIPLAGMLFRNQRDRTVREEIIILLTPHIIKDEQAFAEASEQEQNDIDKLRVGVRRGMMPWGRERLAEAAYEKAAAELAKPEPDKERALFYLDSATNLNPKFREAILLKEQVSGRQLSTSDNSSIRSFVRRRVLADKDRVFPAAPPANVPITVTPRQNTAPATEAQPAMQTIYSGSTTGENPATQPSSQPSRAVVTVGSASDNNSTLDLAGFNGSMTRSSSPKTSAPAGNSDAWMAWLKNATAAAASGSGLPADSSNGDTSSTPATQPTLVDSKQTVPHEPTNTGTAVTELPLDPIEPEPSVEPAPASGGPNR